MLKLTAIARLTYANVHQVLKAGDVVFGWTDQRNKYLDTCGVICNLDRYTVPRTFELTFDYTVFSTLPSRRGRVSAVSR